MTTVNQVLETWNEQIARIEAAPALEPADVAKVIQALPSARSLAALAYSGDELDLVNAALDRFESAVRAKGAN